MSHTFQTIENLQRWDIVHRFCEDDPGPIRSFEEARRVLTIHAGHGARCLQYVAALSRTSTVHE